MTDQPPLAVFLDLLGHVLADLALLRAERGEIAVEQPEQVALQYDHGGIRGGAGNYLLTTTVCFKNGCRAGFVSGYDFRAC